MHVAAGILCCVLQQTSADTPAATFEPLTGLRFSGALDARLSGSWVNVEFRSLLSRIAESRRVAILLDRRIDPSRVLSFEPVGKSVREALVELADGAEGSLTVVGSMVVIAPPAPAGRLRTLIQLRVDELSAEVGRSKGAEAKSRLFSLAQRNTVRWSDLDTPREILERIAGRWKLSVEGLDNVPHDLWAGAVLPDVNAAEALSLVLNQFDLTFQWTDGAAGIRLVAAPKNASLEKRHSPRSNTAAKALQMIEEAALPGVAAEIDGREIKVRGTAEQHEAIEALLKPGSKSTIGTASKTPRPQPGATPLARRTFTLQTQNAPASAVLDKLKQSGLDVRYDAEKLKAAGVNIDKPITLDLNKAPTKELFEAICRPVGAAFAIDGETVTISAN